MHVLCLCKKRKDIVKNCIDIGFNMLTIRGIEWGCKLLIKSSKCFKVKCSMPMIGDSKRHLGKQ